MSDIAPDRRTFVALDTTDIAAAAILAERLNGHVGGLKVGKEFFTAFGPAGVERISGAGLPVFLDLKFHDIPNTVAGAVRAALALKPFMVNVHAAGGADMMKAAMDAAAGAGAGRPLVIAVTVLTSMDEGDLRAVGVDSSPLDQVRRLAALAKASGLDGVVCSAKEVTALRQDLGDDFKLVVPGIRPQWAVADDQKRIVTPSGAIKMGADYLVIGRPITGADDPVVAADRIAKEIFSGK
ncbi:MAG: orotidine-5'-phosphate decarboxylase [Rhodospirillaceae bacterium]|nr:orotidine-5'-phosphate decarboxylase [Rhodospirillaceae bacterium]